MTKEEKAAAIAHVVATLRASSRYEEQAIRNRLGMAERDAGLIIWAARELVFKEDRIEFGPVRGFPGWFERKDWDQLAARAKRQRAKGTRAHARAARKLEVASEMAPEGRERERLRDAADRLALRAAMRAAKTV